MKPWIVNVDTRTKVLLKLFNLKTKCVEGRSKKLLKLPHSRYMWCLSLCTHFHTCQLTASCRQVRKLWIMNVDTITKVLLKFCGLKTMCVEGRSKKLLKLPHSRYMLCLSLCTHSHTCQLTASCRQVMKLWIMNVDTKTKVLLKFCSLKTVCVEGRSKKLLKLPHSRYMWCLSLCTHTHTCQLTILCW